MAKYHKSLRFTTYTLTVLILISSIFFILSSKIQGCLSKTSRVQANILVVEGWLPQYAIELSYSEFLNGEYDYIITSGLKSPEYFLMAMNGYLIFKTENLGYEGQGETQHLIEIDAFSDIYDKNTAHFNVFINDSIITDFYAVKKKNKYRLEWFGDLTDVDSILIEFDNDSHGSLGDRNLYVKSIIIDKHKIPYQYNTEYDIGEHDNRARSVNSSVSYAEIARDRLIALGMDPQKVIAVPGERVRVKRTLTSALAVRQFLNEENLNPGGINVVSLGMHAKRTWMTYNKIFYKKTEIGIISLPDHKTIISKRKRAIKMVRECVAIAIYSIILTAY